MNSIQLHVLQVAPPNNSNRGEFGEPKSVQYGGVTRARESSQAWKRAMRLSGRVTSVTGVPGAERSRHILEEVQKELAEDQKKLALEVVEELYGAPKSGNYPMVLESTPVRQAIRREVIQASADDSAKKIAKKIAAMPMVPDVALYGRFIAAQPSRTIHAALHVAHAISTHTVSNDIDMFTAVDDLQGIDSEEGAGAGHVNYTELRSAVMYRYALLNLDQLAANLADPKLVIFTARGAIEAFLTAQLPGHQTQYANYSLPAFGMAIVGDTAPLSMAGAFECPVRTGNSQGYLQPSVTALVDHHAMMTKLYSLNDETLTFAREDLEIGDIDAVETVECWMKSVTDAAEKLPWQR